MWLPMSLPMDAADVDDDWCLALGFELIDEPVDLSSMSDDPEIRAPLELAAAGADADNAGLAATNDWYAVERPSTIGRRYWYTIRITDGMSNI
ncbi:hypothetical protein DERF_000326 [Dermatophagoides farinae]|uniref:Uncharacterized protein n=1 Tax=Dermatophagoides farinae TaxID=6954 RepID=A0A922L7K7_DERFA|nr:hypothetical protein DERF_000326 [Dermatophagoides farinae]